MGKADDALAELGRYIRMQRELANVSLRSLARVTKVSDSYLSQVERGLYQPSGEVLKAIAHGLGLPVASLYRRLGWLDEATEGDPATPAASVPEAIAADGRLTEGQKAALLQMYRTLVGDAPA